MAFKTYVLVDRLNVTVPIFQRVNSNQRVPIVKRNGYSPFLQITVQDKDGVSKNLRYKETSDTIDLNEQIEKKKIDANAKYTLAEMTDRNFKKGVCITNKVNLQRYLEAYPGCEGSPYSSMEVPMPEYMVYDKTNDSKIQNAELKKRVRAASKVLDLELEGAQAMLIRLNGSFFDTPAPEDFDGTDEEKIIAATEACQNMLVEFVDAAEEAGLDAVLKEDSSYTIDEQTTILLGKLLNADLISFDKIENKVSKKDKVGKWIEVRDMSAEYSLDERKRFLTEFLNTDAGLNLKDDLTKDLASFEKKAKVKKE